MRFAFYGRVSTKDWQDPVTSRARQQDHAAALVAGPGQIVAEFFDVGESRTLPWTRRPQAADLVAALADPDRGWDAIVIGDTIGPSTAASTPRWHRCSSTMASSCGCRRSWMRIPSRAAGIVQSRSDRFGSGPVRMAACDRLLRGHAFVRDRP